MFRYYDTTDKHGNRRQVLEVFDKIVWEKGAVDLNQVNGIKGYELEWTHLCLIDGINSDGLPKIRVIKLGVYISGPTKTHEEEIAKARRWIPQLGELYEIREYTRLTYRSRFYKWFGWVTESKHVYKVIGKDCPDFSFASESWGTQRPSDFEIINQAKKVKSLVESI